MEIHKLVREAITTHKKRIELTQWAIMSGVSSLIYSEYLARIRQKQHPVQMIMVPAIRNVQELLLDNGPFITTLQEELIDRMVAVPIFRKFYDAPELEMFRPENIEIMKTIFDLYITPNIIRRLPETIARKFNLFDEKQQTFREDRSLDLFGRQSITEEQIDYIAEETVLQLMMLMPTLKRDVECPESNIKVAMCESEILSVENENALSPIHFDAHIINDMPKIMELLSFITNTKIERSDWQEKAACKGSPPETVDWFVTSGVFNKIYLTKITGCDTSIDPEVSSKEKEEA